MRRAWIPILAAMLLSAAGAQAVDETLPGPHALEAARHADDQPQDVRTFASELHPAAAASVAPALATRVWGYLPTWSALNLTTFRWDLISDLLVFSYGVGSDGKISTPSVGSTAGWTVATLIEAAHSHGVRVHLVATLFNSSGGSEIASFLGNGTAKAAAATNLAAIAKSKGYDGINFDFEFVPSGSKTDYSAFLEAARATLRAQVPAGVITIAAPPSLGYKGYDFAKIAQVTDGLLVMFYDYHYSGAGYTGPVAPLTKGGFWSASVEADLNALLAVVPASSVSLGVPYYGYQWQAATAAINAQVVPGTKGTAILYRDTGSLAALHGRLWDAPSQTPWLHYTAAGSTQVNQLWYDDAQSIAAKYHLARSKGLQGAMIWALGYDNGHAELWSAIQTELGAPVATDGGSPDAGQDGGSDAGADAGTDGGPADAGADGGDLDGGPADAGDAGGSSGDGGHDGGAPDGGTGGQVDAGQAGPPQTAAPESGCGTTSSVGSGWAALLLLGAALLARRR